MRQERQRILIYCEGERTEVTYFKGIKTDLRAGTVHIVIGREHRGPLRLVKAAIEHQRRAPSRPEDRFEVYDQVWCVFDVEAPDPHDDLDTALQLARKNGVQCAVSNPCFELWLLLHFHDHTRYVRNEDAQRLLEKCPCGYSRRTKDFDYAAIQDQRPDAHDRALRLDQRHRETSSVQKRNPWTSVHVLVDALFSGM